MNPYTDFFRVRCAGFGLNPAQVAPPQDQYAFYGFNKSSPSNSTAALVLLVHNWGGNLKLELRSSSNQGDVVQSENSVVAADDGRCSEAGISILRQGGHAVDAGVATALCLGVVHPMSSGIGGGGFMIVRTSADSRAEAFDSRETAPLAASQALGEAVDYARVFRQDRQRDNNADTKTFPKEGEARANRCLRNGVSPRAPSSIPAASADPASCLTGGADYVRKVAQARKPRFLACQSGCKDNMYEKNPAAKFNGALSMGVPGEVAGLHAAWLKYGRLPWKTLFQPAIRLARDGFVVTPYLRHGIKNSEQTIMADPGLRRIFAPNGKLLEAGDTCYNIELSQTLEAISEQGPRAFYNGSIGENFVKDVQNAGGILTMEDLRRYQVEVQDAMSVNVMGYTVHGMPPPSSGTVGLALVLNILDSFKSSDAAKGPLGLHRLIEAFKHMFAIRMNLGDPDFVNITEYVSDMLSLSYAKELQQKILDNTTFPPSYYLNRWSQLRDHGTSHFCIVDADRNAVSMTTTVNYYFGAGVLSPSTGIVLNNEMDDFSTPTEKAPDRLPPAPSNFIEPYKRPLSSMTPIIIVKDNQLAGVAGASGGIYIIPAVTQVFLNHFILGMDPLASVQHPRIYHKLIPNVVLYENWTVTDGEHIELSQDDKRFLAQRGHVLMAKAGGSVCQLVVHNLQNPVLNTERKDVGLNSGVFHGMLTAVSDPRKAGEPAAL
ncbi:hypothetical protein ACLOJK_000604 [Asimina triloba]